jgi:hypothetical protein
MLPEMVEIDVFKNKKKVQRKTFKEKLQSAQNKYHNNNLAMPSCFVPQIRNSQHLTQGDDCLGFSLVEDTSEIYNASDISTYSSQSKACDMVSVYSGNYQTNWKFNDYFIDFFFDKEYLLNDIDRSLSPRIISRIMSDFNFPSPLPESALNESYSQPMWHEFLWMSKKPSSLINYKLLEVFGVPCHCHRFVIEVEVKDGLVCGTNTLFEDLFKNEPPVDLNKGGNPNQIVLKSRHDVQIFQRYGEEEFFDVILTQLNGASNSTTSILRGMSSLLWSKLKEVVSAGHHFLRKSRIFCFRMSSAETSPECSTRQDSRSKQILMLNHGMENNAVAITAGVEEFTSYKKMPIEDQLILLKEGLVGAAYLFSPYLYDEQRNSFTLTAIEVSDGNVRKLLILIILLFQYRTRSTLEST